MSGNERSRPRVYGCAGAGPTSSDGACSTISPAYITASRSLISSSRDRSWVMKMTLNLRSSRSRSISSRISRCTTTSSAVVGSSMMTTSGSSASAMAIMTRCRMPPESSCGKPLILAGSIPTMSSSSRARAWRAARSICDRCASKMSSNCLARLDTGLRAFIALWKTIEILFHRNRRRSSPSSAITSTGAPSEGQNVIDPAVSSAGGLSIRVSA